jgi:hypothetical protein
MRTKTQISRNFRKRGFLDPWTRRSGDLAHGKTHFAVGFSRISSLADWNGKVLEQQGFDDALYSFPFPFETQLQTQ